MAPSSPTAGKRDPSLHTAFILAMLVGGLVVYNAVRPQAPDVARVSLTLSRGALDSILGSEAADAGGAGEASQRQRSKLPTAELDEGGDEQPEEDELQAARLSEEGSEEEEARMQQDEEEEEEEQQEEGGRLAQEGGGRQQGQAKTDEERAAAFTSAVRKMYSGGLAALAKQAELDPAPNQFRWPHFFIIGFQKCATTSLFWHLVKHPQIEEPERKEPDFFTTTCQYNAMRCRGSEQGKYMREILRYTRVASKNFTTIGFEGTTHYVLEGRWLAGQLRDLFPWLRIVVSMREPISQAISMVLHNLDHNRTVDCYVNNGNRIFNCVYADLDFESRFSRMLRPWIAKFPREQLHVIQYENLTSEEYMRPALRDLKTYIGVDPKLPSDKLGLYNFRHQRKNMNGWEMTRAEYLELVEKARRNMNEVLEIVREHNFADADAWQRNWEAAWQDNLDNNCEQKPGGRCVIQVGR